MSESEYQINGNVSTDIVVLNWMASDTKVFPKQKATLCYFLKHIILDKI